MVHNGALWLRNKPFIHSFWCFDIKTHGTQLAQRHGKVHRQLQQLFQLRFHLHHHDTWAPQRKGALLKRAGWNRWKSGSQKKPGLEVWQLYECWKLNSSEVCSSWKELECTCRSCRLLEMASPVVKSRFSPTDRARTGKHGKITRIQISHQHFGQTRSKSS